MDTAKGSVIRTRSPLSIVLALLAGLAATDASAGNVFAEALINTVGSVSDTNTGATAVAFYPDALNPAAYSLTDRLLIERWADGQGRPANQQSGTNASAYTDYQLWDLAGNVALDPATAAGLDLRFRYRLQGSTLVSPISLSAASAGFWVQNYSGGGYTEHAGNLTVVYGPVPGGDGYIVTGDTRLLGIYDFTLDLVHTGTVTGQMYHQFQGSGGNFALSDGILGLESITLAAGTMPSGGLGVRLETGQIVPVAAVPEIDPAGMGAVAALVAGAIGLLERRRRASA